MRPARKNLPYFVCKTETMDRAYLEIIFLCGLILQIILIYPYLQDYFPRKLHQYFNKRERLYLLLMTIGFQILPLIYILSSWFSWFDYNLPRWTEIPALLFYFFSYWLFFRAYTDLGKSWSPGWGIQEEHVLVTTGIFKWVRHPMYASFASIGVAQTLMLQNWMVGPAFLVFAVPFGKYRIQREEKQLILHFGESYLEYRKKTRALIPEMRNSYFALVIRRIRRAFGGSYLITAFKSRLARARRMGSK